MDDLVGSIRGRCRAHSSARDVDIALRKIGWTRISDWSHGWFGRRVWTVAQKALDRRVPQGLRYHQGCAYKFSFVDKWLGGQRVKHYWHYRRLCFAISLVESYHYLLLTRALGLSYRGGNFLSHRDNPRDLALVSVD